MSSSRSPHEQHRSRLEETVDRLTRKNEPHTFPLTLGRTIRIYILPTRQGLLFIFILFIMLVGSINYNNNLGYLFTFLLSSMTFLSMIQTHRNMVNLGIHAEGMRPVYAGESAMLGVALDSGGRERIGIDVCFKGEENRRVSLTDRRRETIDVPLVARKRGLFRTTPLIISSVFPLGLFRTWATVYPDLEYLVYPKPLAGPFESAYGTGDSDDRGRISVRGTEDFRELRAYRPGDPMSRLFWKPFSRGQGLVTKEFETHTGENLVLSWDNIPFSDPEKKLSRLCDLIISAQRMGMNFGLSLPGIVIPFGEAKDPGHVHRCLSELALFPGQEGEGGA